MRATLSLSHIGKLLEPNTLQHSRECGPHSIKIRSGRNEYEITQCPIALRESNYPIALAFSVIRRGSVALYAAARYTVHADICLPPGSKSRIVVGDVVHQSRERVRD
jgi:hypothetical protein